METTTPVTHSAAATIIGDILHLIFQHLSNLHRRPPTPLMSEAEPPNMQRVRIPFVFAAVCRHWREIVLSMPSFWSYIAIEGGHTPSQFTAYCTTILERSRSCPLIAHIRLATEAGNAHHAAFQVFSSGGHQHRIQELQIYHHRWSATAQQWLDCAMEMDLLQILVIEGQLDFNLTIPATRRLRDLRIYSIPTHYFHPPADNAMACALVFLDICFQDSMELAQIKGILDSCPALLTLGLTSLSFFLPEGDLSRSPIRHPSVTCLQLLDCSTAPFDLEFPNLRDLRVRDTDCSMGLLRTTSQIEQLAIRISPEHWGALGTALKAKPNLHDLRIQIYGHDTETIQNHPSIFNGLPSLSTLGIYLLPELEEAELPPWTSAMEEWVSGCPRLSKILCPTLANNPDEALQFSQAVESHVQIIQESTFDDAFF